MQVDINLISSKYSRLCITKYALILSMFFLVLISSLEVNLYLSRKDSIITLNSVVAGLNKQDSEIRSEFRQGSRKVIELKQKVLMANEIIASKNVSWTLFFEKLEELVPDEIILSRIAPDRKKGVLISGRSKTMKDITNFITALDRSSLFSEPFLKENNQNKNGTVSFSILFVSKELAALLSDGK